MAKPDGIYLCPACRGEGTVEIKTGEDTEYTSSETTTRECYKCRGTGEIAYIDGLPRDEYYAKKEVQRKASREFYDESGCFPYSALVATPSGLIQIGKLTEGEMVLSYQDGILTSRCIVKKLAHTPRQLVSIEFQSTERTIVCTPNHCILTNEGWKKAGKLIPGNEVMHFRSGYHNVISVAQLDIEEPVYNLYTEGEHTYIVDGFVVHNFTHFRTLRTIFYNLFVDWTYQTSPLLKKRITTTNV